MKHWMKAAARSALCCLLCLALLAPAALGEEYRTLQEGDSGEDVTRLKLAMYWLGYFTSQNVSDQYNKVMVERVKKMQRLNGLEETGVADAALQALVYSGDAVKTDTAPKASPVPTPAPTSIPVKGPEVSPALPPLTAEGFLAPEADSEEFVYENEEDGLWLYISASLSITIRRYWDAQNKNMWLEADILCSPETPLTSYLHYGKNGKSLVGVHPVKLATENQVVLGISDDHFGTRAQGGNCTGIIIRNGQILKQKTYAADKKAFPNLETLAVFQDGSMKTYKSDAHTAQEYLDMGATDVYSFGPVLISEGQLSDHMQQANYYHYREPRMALGMIAPYHYFIVAVNGRTDDCRGVYMNWVAEKMLEKNVVEALNLDGGGTAALVFMGKRLNRTGSSVRNLYSMIGFGTSAQLQAP